VATQTESQPSRAEARRVFRTERRVSPSSVKTVPQGVLTPASGFNSATSFSAHSLAAGMILCRLTPTCLAGSRRAQAARPSRLEVALPDLRTPCVLRDSALLPLRSSHSQTKARACVGPNAPVLHHQSLLIHRSVSNRKTSLSFARSRLHVIVSLEPLPGQNAVVFRKIFRFQILIRGFS